LRKKKPSEEKAVFNLVGKRYLFLIISLLIIIPGAISLIFKGLDIGIDFAGGSTLEFRPARHVNATQPIVTLLQNMGLKDVQVNIGSNNTPGNQTVWILLNTAIDKTVQNQINTTLTGEFKNLSSVKFDDLPVTTKGKTTQVTVVTVTTTDAFKSSDIQNIQKTLKDAKLSDTTNPAKVAATATATSGPSPRLTPTVASTATATTQTNPLATADNPANTPVQVMGVTIGSTNDTINILTTTPTNSTLINQIRGRFLDKFGNNLSTLDNSSVSASVASDTIRNSILAVITASLLILLYVWFAFRKVQRPWRYGACAIIALLHDVLVVLGVFSILGWTLHIQVDALFITALLTVVGFSVHDTIVVFDRIRENMQRRSSESFEQIVNASLVQTMSRSLNTSLTVLFTLSALTLFGGESIRTFTLALLIGIFSGTYSSIFNASMLLVIWERGELGFSAFDRDRNLPDRQRRQARERELAKSRS
jgi:preprotein translocase SecF subunit